MWLLIRLFANLCYSYSMKHLLLTSLVHCFWYFWLAILAFKCQLASSARRACAERASKRRTNCGILSKPPSQLKANTGVVLFFYSPKTLMAESSTIFQGKKRYIDRTRCAKKLNSWRRRVPRKTVFVVVPDFPHIIHTSDSIFGTIWWQLR